VPLPKGTNKEDKQVVANIGSFLISGHAIDTGYANVLGGITIGTS